MRFSEKRCLTFHKLKKFQASYCAQHGNGLLPGSSEERGQYGNGVRAAPASLRGENISS
jgi:hypothetical protein